MWTATTTALYCDDAHNIRGLETMPMIFDGRSLNDISLDDIRGLIDNSVPESAHVEYKQEAYDHTKRFEMLRDIVALANGEGGYLILGIQEDNATRRPVQLMPIVDAEHVAQSMRQRCLDSISERIEGLQFRAYLTGFNQGIIVVRVPPSSGRPHMSTLDSRTEFFRRYDTDKKAMTIAEIRNLILSNPLYRPVATSHLPQAVPVAVAPTVAEAEQPSEADPSTEESMSPTVRGARNAEDRRSDGPPPIQLLLSGSVERFLQRYLDTSVVAQSLVIVSPFIGELSDTPYSLSALINKARVDGTRLYVITTQPQEDYQKESMELLQQFLHVEIRYSPNIHAKLYVCWSRNDSESFALFGSANLTEGGFRNNIELGAMVFARGYGRVLLRKLYQWSTFEIRTSSQLIKAITP
jgi:HKD family nuclease